jgi:hypothetical protein
MITGRVGWRRRTRDLRITSPQGCPRGTCCSAVDLHEPVSSSLGGAGRVDKSVRTSCGLKRGVGPDHDPIDANDATHGHQGPSSRSRGLNDVARGVTGHARCCTSVLYLSDPSGPSESACQRRLFVMPIRRPVSGTGWPGFPRSRWIGVCWRSAGGQRRTCCRWTWTLGNP